MAEAARKAALTGIAFIEKGVRSANPLASQTGLNAKRRGLASILDRGIRRGDAIKNKEAMGEGAVTMKFYDDNGAEIAGPEASICLHDVVFTADVNG